MPPPYDVHNFLSLDGSGIAHEHSDNAVGRLTVRDDLIAGTGYLWAPVVLTIADALCAFGVGRNWPDGATSFTTVEAKANFLGSAKEAEVVVAVEDGVLLGSITSCPAGSPWKELAGDGEGEFRLLAVASAARGRGVGEALIRECIARSQATGDRGMALSTMATMTAAHRIYERLGFRRSPEEDWWPGPHVQLLAFRMVY